jgi:hypothetical protein
MLQAVERDLEEKVNFANATSVGCHLLVEEMTNGDGVIESAPSTFGLKKRLLDKFQLGGY